MNQLIVQTAYLPTVYSVASDKASFLAYLKATGRRETTVQTYDTWRCAPSTAQWRRKALFSTPDASLQTTSSI